jgi:hypothetical protein
MTTAHGEGAATGSAPAPDPFDPIALEARLAAARLRRSSALAARSQTAGDARPPAPAAAAPAPPQPSGPDRLRGLLLAGRRAIGLAGPDRLRGLLASRRATGLAGFAAGLAAAGLVGLLVAPAAPDSDPLAAAPAAVALAEPPPLVPPAPTPPLAARTEIALAAPPAAGPADPAPALAAPGRSAPEASLRPQPRPAAHSIPQPARAAVRSARNAPRAVTPPQAIGIVVRDLNRFTVGRAAAKLGVRERITVPGAPLTVTLDGRGLRVHERRVHGRR